MPDLLIENSYGGLVAGVDEAGRGTWAGPVVAAAVVLNKILPDRMLSEVNDSKKLSAKKREILIKDIMTFADVGIGAASVREIEKENIAIATLLAMRRALNSLPLIPALALIDGLSSPPNLSFPSFPITKGDSLSLSIASASIVAKVFRDHLMALLSKRYPAYGWEQNMGYGTKKHRTALFTQGITPHHRRTFAPVSKIVEEEIVILTKRP
tara:strand:- start:1726 stop:2358 length:633 start_codon:yes stop_codon:yes gene_type:complete